MYKSIPHIAQDLDCSVRTVERLIKAMKESGRYPASDFLRTPRRVKWESIIDYGKGKT